MAFILEPELERFRWLTFSDEADARFFTDRFDGRPISFEWRPISVVVPQEDLARPSCDFPCFQAPTYPTFSAKAAQALEDLLVPSGELLPLVCDQGGYYVLNVTRLIEALDLERSDVQRFKSSGEIMRIRKPILRTDRIRSASVFKLAEAPRGDIFVGNVFRQRWQQAGLTGAIFKPVSPAAPAPQR